MDRFKVSALVVAAALVLVLPESDSRACEVRCLCRSAADRGITFEADVREDVAQATEVYQGRVIDVDSVSEQVAALRPEIGRRRGIAHLAVEAVWKGTARDTARLVLSRATSCSYWLEPGERYIIFAYHGRDGELHVTQCSGTTRLSRADSTLAALGDPVRRVNAP